MSKGLGWSVSCVVVGLGILSSGCRPDDEAGEEARGRADVAGAAGARANPNGAVGGEAGVVDRGTAGAGGGAPGSAGGEQGGDSQSVAGAASGGGVSGAVGGGGGSDTGSAGAGAGQPDPALAAALQEILDDAVAREEIASALLGVATADWEWHGASGTVEADGAELAQPGDAFAIHSVTKPFTAVATMIAVERGLIELDQTLASVLEPDVIARLHVVDGVDRSEEITVRQALSHRTGLADGWFDGPTDEAGRTPFLTAILTDPDRQWEPAEVVAWTKEHLEPVAAPGKVFHYSDTNYVLLALALEAVFGRTLPELLRTEILAPLAMEDTWFLFREPERLPAGGALTHVYHGGTDLIPIRAMTADYGGGGLASTTHDLYRFLAGVVSGRLLQDPSSLASLWEFEPDGQGAEYGLGWSRYPDETVSLIGHGGTGGARMFYEENFGIFVVSTVNQSGTDVELLDPVLTTVIMSLI